MYESPMNKIVGEITGELNRQDEENCMVSIRQAVGYQVDKEELIKALNYDRNQYKKGFADALDKIRAEIEGLAYSWCELPETVIDDVLQIIDKYKE